MRDECGCCSSCSRLNRVAWTERFLLDLLLHTSGTAYERKTQCRTTEWVNVFDMLTSKSNV